MKPKSPLPWKRQLLPDGSFQFQDAKGEQVFSDDCFPTKDTMYVLHASNAYPKLVDLLKDQIAEVNVGGKWKFVRRADAEELLKELGEL